MISKAISFKISGFHTEPVLLSEPFIKTCKRFASEPGTVVLVSGTELDCARYNILGVKPWLSLTGREYDLRLTVDTICHSVSGNPFDVLQDILSNFHFKTDPSDPELPIYTGLMGYLSYDLKDCLEILPRTSFDDLGLPDLCLYAPSVILVQDKIKNESWVSIPIRTDSVSSDILNSIEDFKKIISSPAPYDLDFSGDTSGFVSSFSRPDYLRAVETIKEYIRSGDVYQVNMSQRFSMGFQGCPFSLFESLLKKNPAPFFAYIQAGNHQIISTSPERFIFRNLDRVETRPIKGTRPRGKTGKEDFRLKRELSESLKDDAELSMIVDLLRNDIGKVCKPGSVRVSEHKRVEAYQNVYHLVSDVVGILDSGMDSVDLLKAVFPGGSITGCPKIRAMEIIDELEPVRRHIYTGSIGYISFHDTLDLSIAIRTATVTKGKIFFSVGGGIVFDSDPSDEYEETLHKGKTLMGVFEGKNSSPVKKQKLWMNGTIIFQDKAQIPVESYGVQYGYGLFETIRAVKGKPLYLEDHLDRFEKSWKALYEEDFPDITWNDVISKVLQANHLENEVAAVKIMAIKAEERASFSSHLVVMARAYTHRLELLKTEGLRLISYPEPRQTPLASHKSLNYLYYFLAGKWAKENQADEALIINPDGSVSETNTGNILAIYGKTLIQPESAHVLGGIMEKKACEVFTDWGFSLKRKPLSIGDLFAADHLVVTNSLMGAVPVMSLDGRPLLCAVDICRKINELRIEN